MGKIDIKTKVLDKATALWKGFIKKSPVFVALTSLTVVSVLGLGVGGTLAATGVIPNPFASPDSNDLSTDDAGSPSVSTDIREEFFGPDFDATTPENSNLKKVSDLGWTGVSFVVTKDGYNLIWRVPANPNSSDPDCYLEVIVNDKPWGALSGQAQKFPDCAKAAKAAGADVATSQGMNSLSMRSGNPYGWQWEQHFCKGVVNTWTVKAYGALMPTEKSGVIAPENVPDGASDCGGQPSPSGTPEQTTTPLPSPESVLVTPSPGSSHSPESSSEPVSSPTPNP